MLANERAGGGFSQGQRKRLGSGQSYSFCHIFSKVLSGIICRVPFETFKRQRISPTTEPLVTIQRKGIFSLNPAAYEALGKPDAVELLYDREARLVGLRKVSKAAAHAYKVRPVGKSATSWIVSGIAFINYYDIAVPEPVRRSARLEKDTLVIDLNDPGTAVPSSTGGRKAT